MNDASKITRRAACGAVLGMGGGLLLARSAAAAEIIKKARPAKLKTYRNADFYDADGKFDQQRAKNAYLALMEHFGYPINDTVRKNLFVADFGRAHFAEVGLGGVVWLSEKKGNYTSIEVFLLPNQMIPEHWHVALEDEGVGVKMESWVVRYGSTYTYGEGEPTRTPAVKIPECQAKFVTAMHEKALKPGESTGIKTLQEKHWQQAGPEGCILTEVSTYHEGKAVRFTDPNIKF
jgi:D-lyxose ketol-isomerase